MKLIILAENTPYTNTCSAEHGLSLYIETKKHKLLMDFGASELFLRNASLLNVDLTQVDTCILSHGHYDHAGGILPFAAINPHAPIYAKSTAGNAYYNLSNYEKYIGIDKEILKLPQCIFIDEDLQIDEELFLFTNITGDKFPSKGNLYLKQKISESFVPDTFEHEQCLVIFQQGQQILLSGCAHNGIVNILEHHHKLFERYPDIVISGFHLKQKDAYSAQDIDSIRQIGQELQQTGAVFYTGHCTGETAFQILKEVMGEKLQQLHSGETVLL